MPGPDLEIRGGGQSSTTFDKRGGGLQKNFLGPLGLSLV